MALRGGHSKLEPWLCRSIGMALGKELSRSRSQLSHQ